MIFFFLKDVDEVFIMSMFVGFLFVLKIDEVEFLIFCFVIVVLKYVYSLCIVGIKVY